MDKTDRLKISIENWKRKHEKLELEKAKEKERKEKELQDLIEELTGWKNFLEDGVCHWKNFDVVSITEILEREIDDIISADNCKLDKSDERKLDEMRILINKAKKRKGKKKKGERYGNFLR